MARLWSEDGTLLAEFAYVIVQSKKGAIGKWEHIGGALTRSEAKRHLSRELDV